jgi:hypothetical protein
MMGSACVVKVDRKLSSTDFRDAMRYLVGAVSEAKNGVAKSRERGRLRTERVESPKNQKK